MPRIPDTTLSANFSDGQILYGADINKIVSVLKAGVNYNKADIDKMLMGVESDFIFPTTTAMESYLLESTPDEGQYCFVLGDSAEVYQYTSGSWVKYNDFSLLEIMRSVQEGTFKIQEEDPTDGSEYYFKITGEII